MRFSPSHLASIAGLVIAAPLILHDAGRQSAAGSAVPVGPVRMCAEWEPAFGTLVRWPFAFPSTLARELAEDDSLYVLVDDLTDENACRSAMGAWGANLQHLRFIYATTYSEWTRDWGPLQMFDGDGAWAIVDPIFDGYPWVPPTAPPLAPRGGGFADDDVINQDVAEFFDADLHPLPAYCTGGNIMTDGYGIAFSTTQMVNENAPLWSESEFRDLASDYLGLDDYHFLHGTENVGIQHIDCWAKLLDEETILVKRPPTWHEEYGRIEQNIDLLEGMLNCFGRPYRILRVECPTYSGSRVAAYCNSLILNDKVLVPLFGIAGDAPALDVYRAAMPGYEVIGYYSPNWYYYDALHCRTMGIFDRGMLRIEHRPLDAEIVDSGSIEVSARIDDRSETGLDLNALRLRWRLVGALGWNEVALTPMAAPDSFAAAITPIESGDEIEYYLTASDLSGRTERVPRRAPAALLRTRVVPIPASANETEALQRGLFTAHPNPFTTHTTIRLRTTATAIPALSPLRAPRFEIIDVAGRIVFRAPAAGVSGPAEEPALHWVWDGRDQEGRQTPAGSYFLRANDGRSSVRIVRTR